MEIYSPCIILLNDMQVVFKLLTPRIDKVQRKNTTDNLLENLYFSHINLIMKLKLPYYLLKIFHEFLNTPVMQGSDLTQMKYFPQIQPCTNSRNQSGNEVQDIEDETQQTSDLKSTLAGRHGSAASAKAVRCTRVRIARSSR